MSRVRSERSRASRRYRKDPQISEAVPYASTMHMQAVQSRPHDSPAPGLPPPLLPPPQSPLSPFDLEKELGTVLSPEVDMFSPLWHEQVDTYMHNVFEPETFPKRDTAPEQCGPLQRRLFRPTTEPYLTQVVHGPCSDMNVTTAASSTMDHANHVHGNICAMPPQAAYEHALHELQARHSSEMVQCRSDAQRSVLEREQIITATTQT